MIRKKIYRKMTFIAGSILNVVTHTLHGFCEKVVEGWDPECYPMKCKLKDWDRMDEALMKLKSATKGDRHEIDVCRNICNLIFTSCISLILGIVETDNGEVHL